jgi:hypothetical protein
MVEDEEKQVEQAELPLEVQPAPRRAAAPVEDEDVLEWTCHPVRRRPLVSLAVTLFVVMIGVVVYMATASNVFTVLTLVVLYASLAKFYFPTHYRFTGHGIEVKTTTQKLFKPWSMYRSMYPDKNGVLFSPFTRPTRLENFRGMYVLFADNRDAVIEYARNHVGVKAADSGTAQKRNDTPTSAGGEK